MDARTASKVVRYLISGTLAFLVNIGVYALLIYEAHIWYIVAAVFAFSVALVFSFFLQKMFTFREQSTDRILRQFYIYVAFILFNLGANTLLLFLLVTYGGMDKIIGYIVSNALIAVWSFFVYEKIIFSKRTTTSSISSNKTAISSAVPKISIVIPCHNEAESIGAVLNVIPQGVYEIIVVDNNCTDHTAEIARAHGARVVTERRPGYGAALKCGFAAAQGEIIAAFDGDNQYPAYEVLPMVHFLISNDLDFVSAARFPLQDPSAMSPLRQFGNWGLTIVADILFNMDMGDSLSGMWVFKKEVLAPINYLSDGMTFSQELKIKVARQRGVRFAEYSIPYHPRIGDSKLIPIRHGIICGVYLLLLRFGLK
jgi:putative flippase GtrA